MKEESLSLHLPHNERSNAKIGDRRRGFLTGERKGMASMMGKKLPQSPGVQWGAARGHRRKSKKGGGEEDKKIGSPTLTARKEPHRVKIAPTKFRPYTDRIRVKSLCNNPPTLYRERPGSEKVGGDREGRVVCS